LNGAKKVYILCFLGVFYTKNCLGIFLLSLVNSEAQFRTFTFCLTGNIDATLAASVPSVAAPSFHADFLVLD